MAWIYEHQNWPKFTWNNSVFATKLSAIRNRQGRLLGRMESLGFEFKNEAILSTLTSDIVNSSMIEGEKLDPHEVRSSIAKQLGINIGGLLSVNRSVEGIVEMMLDATQNYNAPLTQERLFNWHAALFPTGRSGLHWITVGDWRLDTTGPMQVISGPLGRERVHFEAPPSQRLEHEMTLFLNWFETSSEIDPVIKAGLAHFWFVTIHPFEDGNGRIARAIADMALARSDHSKERFYSMSSQIALERKQYYLQLEYQQQADLDVTRWLDWFLDCLDRAITQSEITSSEIIFKVQFWECANKYTLNKRQRLVLTRLLNSQFEGFMSTSKYAKLSKCSEDTALRDIQDLKKNGILIQNANRGRSTSYRIPNIHELNNQN